jgi:hypothetical protein
MRFALVAAAALAGCAGDHDPLIHTTLEPQGPNWPTPTLAAAPGWHLTMAVDGGIASAEASTVPSRDAPGAWPEETLKTLPPSGILIVAFGHRGQERRENESPQRDLPYELSQFRHDEGWEGQPAPNVPQYVLWTTVDRHLLDVRVFFGTQDPSDDQLARAQAELNTLSWG